MEIFKAVLLGIVQGLTEFLPISSSGHLIIGARILGFDEPGIFFEIFLHVGTLLAVICVFYRELWLMACAVFTPASKRRENPALNQAFLWDIYVIIATIPAVFAGLFVKDSIERVFASVLITFLMLAVTGAIMVLSSRISPKNGELTWIKALLIGCAQAFAILPGISRSGTTIFTGMLLGVHQETAARFSFIMSIPAIIGAAVLKCGDVFKSPPSQEMIQALLSGTAASVITGYLAIILLLQIVRKGRLHWFGYYCFCVSGAGLSWYVFFH